MERRTTNGNGSLIQLVGGVVVGRQGLRRESDAFLYELREKIRRISVKESLDVALHSLKNRGYVCPRIYRREDDLCELVLGLDLPPEVSGTSFGIDNPILKYLFEEGNSVYHNQDISSDPGLVQGSYDPLRYIPQKGFVAVRYDTVSDLLEKEISGVMIVNYDPNTSLTKNLEDGSEIMLLDQVGWFIADSVARLLEIKHFQKLNEKLTQQIKLDGPTGLFNKKNFHENLEEYWAEVERGERVYYLLLLDFDRFKAINDSYGHAEGDLVITKVGEHLRQTIHPRGKGYRVGGDEFALTLSPSSCLDPEESDAEMLAFTKELQKGIHQLYVPTGSLPLSASFGVVSARKTQFKCAEDWYRQADAASYEAKRCGRDRIAFYGQKEIVV